MGYLESDPFLMEHYDFLALPFHLYHANFHNDELKRIQFQKYDYLILAYSLLSIQYPQLVQFIQDYPKFYAQFHDKIVSIVGGAFLILEKRENKFHKEFGESIISAN